MLKLATSKTFPDLVNNYELFHEYFSSKLDELKSLPEWNDDRNYSNLQTLDELLSSLNPEDIDPSLEYTVKAYTSQLYSSPEDLNGFDRTRSCFTPSGMKICKDNLNKEINSEKIGFCSEAAGSCAAYLRYDPSTDTFITVKHRGNHRTNMLLLTTKGEDTFVKLTIKFHPIKSSYEEMLRAEAQGHFIDAQQQKGQNEGDKFVSGVRANDPLQKAAYRFLKKNKINYQGIMQKTGVEGCEDWISITSLTGLTSGIGNGIFRHYNEENVVCALDTIKKVAEITGETTFSSTALHCISQMYYCLTEFSKKGEEGRPLFTKEELDRFFCDWFYEKNLVPSWRKNKEIKLPIYGLCELTQSGSVKNYAYLYVKTFWPDIVLYWKEALRESKYGFGLECEPANQILMRTDKLLKGDVRTMLASY